MRQTRRDGSNRVNCRVSTRVIIFFLHRDPTRVPAVQKNRYPIISNFYDTPKLPGYLRWWRNRYPKQITQESHQKYIISIGKNFAVVAKRVTRVAPTTPPDITG